MLQNQILKDSKANCLNFKLFLVVISYALIKISQVLTTNNFFNFLNDHENI